MLYCGKFFVTKKHKLPDLNEIRGNAYNMNSYQSVHSNYDNTNLNSQFTNNNINEPVRSYANTSENRHQFTNSVNWNLDEMISTKSRTKNEKKQESKDRNKKSLSLNMNYSNDGNLTNSSLSKKYDEQPPDSFFYNKLQKQPPSNIKLHHHHKHKQNPGFLPEIPENLLNRRIDYQYSSPTKVPLEVEIQNYHKKHNHKNNVSPETPKGKLETSKENIDSNSDQILNVKIEEEEEEFEESESVQTTNPNSSFANKKAAKLTLSDSSKNQKLYLEEEENVNEIINNKFSSGKNSTSYNTTNYSKSNSYKSTSSIQNEEEEFNDLKKQVYSKFTEEGQFKDNKNSIATSPFYKPNLQFQQFNDNEDINELSQSQTIKPPKNGQPQNLSRNNRIKAVTKAKKTNSLKDNNYTDSFLNISEQISANVAKKQYEISNNAFSSQDKTKSPQDLIDQISSRSLKKKSPKADSKGHSVQSPQVVNDHLFQKSNQKVSPDLKHMNNDYYSQKDSLSAQFINNQTNSKQLKGKSPISNPHKSDASTNNSKSPKAINEQVDNKSIKKKSLNSSSRQNYLSPTNNSPQISNEPNISSDSNSFKSISSQNSQSNSPQNDINNNQQNSKSAKKKSISSNSTKSYPSSQIQTNSPQNPNEIVNAKSAKKKSPVPNSIKNHSSSASQSNSPQNVNDQLNIKSAQKKSPGSNSQKSYSSSKSQSNSPQNSNEMTNLKSSQKKSPGSNSLKKSTPPQSQSNSPQNVNEQLNSKSAKKKSPTSNSVKNHSSSRNNSKSPRNNKDQIDPKEEIDDQDDGEPIFFERLQLSEKESSNSDKFENYESNENIETNELRSNQSYHIQNNFYEEEEQHISGDDLMQNDQIDNEINNENEQIEDHSHFNAIDIVIEEEEEEEVNENSLKNEEESIVMLSELQNNNEISPLPKKKSSGYPVSFNKFSSDSLNINNSEIQINDSLAQVLKTENKEQSSVRKSIILDEEANEAEEELSEEDLSQSNKSFSSILSSKKPTHGNNEIHQSNLLSSIDDINDEKNEEEEDKLDDLLVDNENEEEDKLENLPMNNEEEEDKLEDLPINNEEEDKFEDLTINNEEEEEFSLETQQLLNALQNKTSNDISQDDNLNETANTTQENLDETTTNITAQDNLDDTTITTHDYNSDDEVNTIQDVIFEEEFNIIPTDSNLLDSDDAENVSINHESVKIANESNKAIVKEVNIKSKVKKTNRVLNDSLFSDCSANSSQDIIDISQNQKNIGLLGEKAQNDLYDDIHSSEIRYLIESTDQNQEDTGKSEEEEESNESFQGIQSLPPQYLEHPHIVNIVDEDNNEIFDFDDNINEEEEDEKASKKNNLKTGLTNSTLDEELKKAVEKSFFDIESSTSKSSRSNNDNLKIIYDSIKFNHPSIRFGFHSITRFSDKLLKRELNNVL